MQDSLMACELRGRFEPLMHAAGSRVSMFNPEIWEHHTGELPAIALDTLARFRSDADAMHWLLLGARTEEMIWVVLGYRELLKQLTKPCGNASARQCAARVLTASGLSEAMRLLAAFHFAPTAAPTNSRRAA